MRVGTDTGASVRTSAGGVSTGTGGVSTGTGGVGKGASPQDMVAAVTSGLNGHAATTTSVPTSVPASASISTSISGAVTTPTPDLAPPSSTSGNGRGTDMYNTPTWPAQSHTLNTTSNSNSNSNSKSQNSPPIVPILPLPLPPSDPVIMGGKIQSYGVEKVSTDVNSTLQKGLRNNDTIPLSCSMGPPPLLSTPVKSKSTATADPAAAGDIDGTSTVGFGTDNRNKKGDTVATGGCCVIA